MTDTLELREKFLSKLHSISSEEENILAKRAKDNFFISEILSVLNKYSKTPRYASLTDKGLIWNQHQFDKGLYQINDDGFIWYEPFDNRFDKLRKINFKNKWLNLRTLTIIEINPDIISKYYNNDIFDYFKSLSLSDKKEFYESWIPAEIIQMIDGSPKFFMGVDDKVFNISSFVRFSEYYRLCFLPIFKKLLKEVPDPKTGIRPNIISLQKKKELLSQLRYNNYTPFGGYSCLSTLLINNINYPDCLMTDVLKNYYKL